MKKELNIALCKGRHDIPQAKDGAIFPTNIDPLDLKLMETTVIDFFNNMDATSVNLYVTGLTVALVEVVKYCYQENINLTLHHFNRDTGTYYPQVVNRVRLCPFCGGPAGNGWACQTCGAT
jgi:hypothetical protein